MRANPPRAPSHLVVLRCLLTSSCTVFCRFLLLFLFLLLQPIISSPSTYLTKPHQSFIHSIIQPRHLDMSFDQLTKIAVLFVVIPAAVYVWFAGVFINHIFLDIPTQPKSKVAIIRTDWEAILRLPTSFKVAVLPSSPS
jgi:hypothetical protein